jgi:hypothetical protein
MAGSRKKNSRKTPLATINQSAEETILSRALEHPELGPQRLAALLKAEGLDVSRSEVQLFLRRKGLQTRKLRLEFLSQPPPQEEAPAAAPLFEVIAAQSPDVLAVYPSRPLPDELTFKPEGSPSAAPRPEPSIPAPIAPRKNGKSSLLHGIGNWVFLGANLVLAGLAVLFAIQIGDLLQNGVGTLTSESVASLLPQAVSEPAKEALAAQPTASLGAYRVIVERNLFRTVTGPKDENPDARLAQIKLAGSDLGLKLIGTIVYENSGLNQAVIESTAQRTQEIYHERDSAGKVLVKRILRNNVIIENDKGELRLTVDYENIKTRPVRQAEVGDEKPQKAIAPVAGLEKPQKVITPDAGLEVPQGASDNSSEYPDT